MTISSIRKPEPAQPLLHRAVLQNDEQAWMTGAPHFWGNPCAGSCGLI